MLDDLQAAPVAKLPVDEEWVTVPSGAGDVRVRIIKPQRAEGTLPVILYLHGGGWVLGNAGTHDRLVRDSPSARTPRSRSSSTPRSPEARYPVAIEQCYATAQWLVREDGGRGSTAHGSRSPVTRLAATWPRCSR